HAVAVTVRADAAYDEVLPGILEIVSPANIPDQGFHARLLELDPLVAHRAVHVLVLRVSVLVLVVFPGLRLQAAEQPRIDELGESAIDGRPADVQSGPAHVLAQGIS